MNLETTNAVLGGLLAFVNAGLLGWLWKRLRRDYLGNVAPTPGSMVWMTLLIGGAVAYGSHPASLSGAATWDSSPVLVVPVGVALFTLGAPMILIDARTSKLPNVLTFIFGVEVLLGAQFAVFFQAAPVALYVLLASTLLWLIPVGVGNLAGQVGLGDVKVAPIIGLALGTTSFTLAAAGLLLAVFSAGGHALVLKYKGSNKRFPLGPHLLGAAMIVWGLVALGTKVPL